MVGEGRHGPGRSEEARLAILHAAAARVRDFGYDQLTMEGIAADAKVGKQTIYRWWPSRSALVADCLSERLLLPELLVPPDSGDIRADLIKWINNIVGFLRLPGNSSLLRSLIVAAAQNSEVAARLNDSLGLWEMFGKRFQAAIADGQLSPDTPVMEMGDALIGALVLRDLRGGELEKNFAKRLVNFLLQHPKA